MDDFIRAALEEAQKGLNEGGIPIGAVLVKDGRIIARGRNRRVQDDNPILHAEIDCLQNAVRTGSYANTVLYSTLMPCYFCAGAVVQFGIKKVVVGESQTFEGAGDFMESKGVEVVDMNLEQCMRLMQDFIHKNPGLWNEDIGKPQLCSLSSRE